MPLLYLLFDDLNPALAKRCPALSEALDNVVVFVLPGVARVWKRLIQFLPSLDLDPILAQSTSSSRSPGWSPAPFGWSESTRTRRCATRRSTCSPWSSSSSTSCSSSLPTSCSSSPCSAGGCDQLLDPHPHAAPLHALPLLHQDLPLPWTLHLLERHEGVFIFCLSSLSHVFMVGCHWHVDTSSQDHNSQVFPQNLHRWLFKIPPLQRRRRPTRTFHDQRRRSFTPGGRIWTFLLFTALLAAVYFSLYSRWHFPLNSQDCDSLVNHTDTEAMVLEANLSKEIHEEHSGILRLTLLLYYIIIHYWL